MSAPGRARRPYTPRVPLPQRREQILDAALRIIDRDGYRAVSIDAIARELDVTRPVVYHAFSGLEELLGQLLDRQERRALDALMRTMSVPPDLTDPAGYLRGTVTDLAAMVRADPLTWKPILLASVDTPPAVQDRIGRDRELVRRRFQGLVELVQAASGGANEADPEVVSHALLALAEYFGRLLLDRPEDVDAERLATTMSALFLPPGRRPHGPGPGVGRAPGH